MSVPTLPSIAARLRAVLVEVAWAQWSGLEGWSAGTAARSIVDPEAPLLVSCWLEAEEPRLWRVARAWARGGARMPKDNIDRAIKKAAGGGEADYTEMTYEGYAPGGVAIFVDAATNNPTRTIANVRSYFTKCDGNIGTSGSLAHVFERKAEFVIENAALKGRDGDEFEMEAIDAGADDVIRDEEGFTILAPYNGFGSMAHKLEQLGVETKSAELKRFPLSTMPVHLNTARNVKRLVDLLDEDDDVNAVYHNMELDLR